MNLICYSKDNKNTGRKKRQIGEQNMKYFKDVKTVAELRVEYVRLLKENHPDNGGSTAICQEIIAEYNAMKDRLPDEDIPKNSKGEEKFTRAQMDEFDELIRSKLDEIIHFSGVNIEVVGLWIWLDGNTYPWKDQIKEAGFQWSRSRKKWHYSPYDTGKFYKGRRMDFDAIRRTYGSATVNTEERAAIA